MRVILIAAVLAVFATPAAATGKCNSWGAKTAIEKNGMDYHGCSCLIGEIAEHMRIYFAIDPLNLSDLDGSTKKLVENSQKALDNANKLANIHAKICRFEWKYPHRPN